MNPQYFFCPGCNLKISMPAVVKVYMAALGKRTSERKTLASRANAKKPRKRKDERDKTTAPKNADRESTPLDI